MLRFPAAMGLFLLVFTSGCTLVTNLDSLHSETGASTCGNGKVETGEDCDDGNTTSNDGCSSACHRETGASTCGNGKVETGEDCDDSNTTSGDGCSSTCVVECDTSVARVFYDAPSMHCYRESLEEITWDAAEAECELWHGYLVSITSDAEQNFIESIVENDASPAVGAWIGLNDKAVDGAFVWSSGEPYVEVNKRWGAGEPDDHMMHVKNCIFFNEGNYWNDYQCDVPDPLICERSPGVP